MSEIGVSEKFDTKAAPGHSLGGDEDGTISADRLAAARRAWNRLWSGDGRKAAIRRSRLLGALALVLWASTGVYKVQPDEQGVVLRFGKWIETREPGLHFHLPYPIDTVLLPQVTQINQLQLGGGDAEAQHNGPAMRQKQMLTGDENIVEADGAVSWRIKDAGQFLFQVDQPELAVGLAAESALREVIGRTQIQAALSDQRQQITDQTKALLQRLLDDERAGIEVTQVQLLRVDPPAAVIDAFNDVQRARADQERARNEAEAYANDVLPRARGEAERIGREAEAYRAQAVNFAEGEAKSFLAVYDSYRHAEEVTAWRLYLDGVDQILKKSARVVVEATDKNFGVAPYLPLTEVKPTTSTTGDRAPK